MNEIGLSESKQLNDHIIKQLEEYFRVAPIEMGVNGEGYRKLRGQIAENLNKLYVVSNRDSFFWGDCSLKTYEKTFSARLLEIEENLDPDISDDKLLLQDYRYFDLLLRQRVLLPSQKSSIASHSYREILEQDNSTAQILLKFNDARKNKMEFIQNFFERKGSRIVKDGDSFSVVDLKTVKIEDEVKSSSTLAYQIALLEESGILKMLGDKGWNKETQYKFLSELLGASKRTVKGNCLVLNPRSEEDRFRYTAFEQLETAKEYLDKLSK